MTDNADHRYIPRHELKLLRGHLRDIPELAEDLAIALMRQDRYERHGGAHRRPSEQPLPFSIEAHEAAEHLHNVLGGWVRITCEHRARHYDGPDTTPGLSRWLLRHLETFAMIEGTETARGEIKAAMNAAERIACPPPMIVHVDTDRIEEARALWLNARGIATLARDLGDEWRHLTRRRVHVLAEAGLITPVPGPWHPRWPTQWIVGEVLDAHLQLPIRRRDTRRDRRVNA
ncbi:hypothetical protein [Nocardia fluminea]|uniref:hypothetical protein n=1 Tax=Nocardia fluminea TaxID=134984 RepID=UPI003661C1FE